MTSSLWSNCIGGVLYLRCCERTHVLIGGLGRASLFHRLFLFVGVVCLRDEVRVVRKRDWIMVLGMVSRLAESWMGLVCVFGPRCF